MDSAMRLARRKFLHLAAGAAALPGFSLTTEAQTYPSRPISLIVFVPPGGTPDIIARLICQSMSQRLGQSIVIDNRPGAGGNLALQAVARAPADGYTLLLVATPHAINVTLYEKSTVTLTREIVPVARIKIKLASAGTGNLTHLCGELLRMMTGIDVVHVP